MPELDLITEADERARAYLQGIETRLPFPDQAACDALVHFTEALPEQGRDAAETLRLLDSHGSPATTASNGPRYFGFVVGATLPVAAAAERLALAWDQCASSQTNSPAAAAIEAVAGRWLLEILDLPRESAVGFGTSATACTLTCLSAARRALLARHGWDFDRDGLFGAPEVKVVVSETVHITVLKALRLLGFGMKRLLIAPVDGFGRIDPARLPPLDDRTILCLQAGEVNSGEFDPFVPLIAAAQQARAWVHVDGAFGLWARASARRALTEGIDGADSWTTDGHKTLNTPYDGAVALCRDAEALALAMNSAAVYAPTAGDAQSNLTLEFSRRARGIAIWAALRTLGREGVAALVDGYCDEAAWLADRLRGSGLEVLNRVVFNQVLVRCGEDARTARVREAVLASGAGWFGATVWQGRPAFRISLSSWRTRHADVERLVEALLAADRATL